MTEQLPAEMEALALAVLVKLAKARQNTTAALFSGDYEDGAKHTFRSPIDDRQLGYVQRTDPDPEWRVTNREVLHQYLRQDPDNLETYDEVAGEEAEVVAVLAEHAAHLLVSVTRVSDDAISRALADARDGKEPAPGIERIKPGGVLRVVPHKDAAAAIGGLVRAGWLTWDGRRALPAADGEAAS